ncbi:MAG: Aminodeoxychorismate lyase (EC [uncultured Sulfurovum sp.]|uniref:Aminodeoxychorismate lyase (EC) n=1 Tax=uncultured Sulfurovum sp. TaxID=269237 RepID=A0A6S6U154_9BACT|nr:MAG: Aminodeoxychorismate lyase (EC [uncultured Sulfurovum sp.]
MTQTLFETIKIEDGKIFNLKWHNQRFNRSRKELFQSTGHIDLIKHIKTPKTGLYRCKIIYNDDIQSIDYFPYEAKIFKNFKIIKSQIHYNYKYTNRSHLQKLSQKAKGYDEIIIEKDTLLTDTSIANIAFFNGESWLTPAIPLLFGTTRARLLDEGFLKLSNIKKEDIKDYSHFALMNAMIGFRIQKSVSIQV